MKIVFTILISIIISSNATASLSCAKSAFSDQVKNLGRLKNSSKLRLVTTSQGSLRLSLRALIRAYDLGYNYSYEFSAGGTRVLSVHDHTLATTARFLKDYPYNKKNLERLDLSYSIKSRNLLLTTLLIHDVGKAYAYDEGRSSFQDKYNGPLVKALLNMIVSLNPLEKRISYELILNSQVGDLLQSKIGYKNFLSNSRLVSRRLGLKLSDYLLLSKIFFLSDAGSYEYLVHDLKVFEENKISGLQIKNQAWKDFELSWKSLD